MDKEQIIKDLQKRVAVLEQKRLYQQDISNKAVKARHIDGLIIFRGNSSDLPSDGSTEIQIYYSEDTKTLNIWNTVNEVWETEAFT